jgi:hypothetical protein
VASNFTNTFQAKLVESLIKSGIKQFKIKKEYRLKVKEKHVLSGPVDIALE